MAKIIKSKVGRPAQEWQKDKIAILKKLYPNKSTSDVAKEMGLTERAVRSAAMRFKIKKSNRYWDKPETDYLLKNWPVMSAVEIAAGLKENFKIDKTRWAVINKYRELTDKRPGK